MLHRPRDTFRVLPQYQPLMRMLGIDAEAIFTHPQIVPWRTLEDRENCILDATAEGKPIRLHIKRYSRANRVAEDEVKAFELLRAAQIPTMSLVGWGSLSDGQSFVITEHLAGYEDAEKLVQGGLAFERLLQPTADLAARLHAARLHHRDLYLCHFFARPEDPGDVRLIDVARVRRLGALLPNRWIVKDLAQFRHSTMSLAVTDEQRNRWLCRYAASRKIELTNRIRRAIERKAARISQHDARLRAAQPGRNISIPK